MAEYRFDNITGQETAVRHLQNAIRTGQVSQAYLISGEPGTGKMDLALAFASVLQCRHCREESGRIEPCGQCSTCRRIAAGTHPDVIVLTNERAGAETKTNTIGVKTTRFVQTDISIRPYEGPYKIYIVPEAQNLNPQAQNALLKTLEEPPAYAVILLLAQSTSTFLPTVLSRCVQLPLRAVPESVLLDALARQGITGDRALLCARLSHGNPGRCLQLAQDEKLETFRTELAAFLKKMPGLNSYELVQYAEGLVPKGRDGGPDHVGDFLDLGQSWFRDILVQKRTKLSENLIFRDEVQYISTVAERLSYASLEEILEAFDEAQRRRAAKGNEVQILEVLMMRIRRAMK